MILLPTSLTASIHPNHPPSAIFFRNQSERVLFRLGMIWCDSHEFESTLKRLFFNVGHQKRFAPPHVSGFKTNRSQAASFPVNSDWSNFLKNKAKKD